MGWDVPDLTRQHDGILRLTDIMVTEALETAGSAVKTSVERTTAFKQRSPSSLKNTTKIKFLRTTRGRMVRAQAGKAYGAYVEKGTRAHEIRARGGGWLRFQVGGSTLFRKSVKHPGTRATWFLRDAARHGGDVLGRELEEGLTRIASKSR